MDSTTHTLDACRAERARLSDHLEDLDGGTLALNAYGQDVTALDQTYLRRRIGRLDAIIARGDRLATLRAVRAAG